MNLIPLFVALPLLGGFILAVLGEREKASDALVVSLSLFLFGLSFWFIPQTFKGKTLLYSMGGWLPPWGIVLVLDALSLLMLLIINGVALFSLIYSLSYMRKFTAKAKYYALFMLMLAGMNGVVLTGDFFNLFVFVEIASVASYALVAFGGEGEELEASFKYMVMGSIASMLILFSVGLIYGLTGSLNMADVGRVIKGKSSFLLSFTTVLLLGGFGLKAALMPFHAWLPDAHPSAPAPISSMLSGVVIKALGVYVLARIFFNVLGMSLPVKWVFLTLGALSMTGGALLALQQTDFKRLLAYSSISQIGYIVLGLGAGTPWGLLGALFHLLNHATFKSLLFLNSGAVEYSAETRDLNKMGGLSQVMPVTGSTSTIGSLSISGIPPFNGFWSKLFIIMGLVQGKYYALSILTILISILTLAYYLKVQRYAFFGKLKEELKRVKEVPFSMKLSMIILASICVGVGIAFIPVMGVLLKPAASILEEGITYTTRVLGG